MRACDYAVLASAWVALACTDNSPSPTANPVAPSAPATSAAAHQFQFVDVAASAGITRVTLAGRDTKDHLLDSAGTGCAWIDYDRDGDLDAYLVNAWRIAGGQVTEKGMNALYRNRGDGTFEDVTESAHVGGEGAWGSGVAVADYDGDTWPDLLVTNFGLNLLYQNLGNGTFKNVAAACGVECPGWNTGATLFDADRDGRLDLYVAAYINCTLDDVLKAKRTLDWKGVEKVALGPFGLAGAADHYFHATDHGTFEDVTEAAGMTDRALAFGFSVRAADLDLDHDLDLYVANDSDANYLYRNDGHGVFQDIGLWSGAALDQNGVAQAGMGVTLGDADQDGQPDLFVTNFAEDFSTLYRGTGQGFFEDASVKSGVGPPTYLPLSWGTTFADLDSDGDLDLVVANGHIYPQVDRHPEVGMTYLQKPLLLENTGAGKFVDASARAGPGFATARCSRGLAAGDYDNDGDVDLLITNLDAPPTLLRNDSTHGAWLTVACEVPAGRCPLVGTVVTVTALGRTQTRDVTSSDSFLSCPDPRLHFGLGAATVVDQVVVTWSDQTTTALERVAVNQVLTVRKTAK